MKQAILCARLLSIGALSPQGARAAAADHLTAINCCPAAGMTSRSASSTSIHSRAFITAQPSGATRFEPL